MARWALDLTYGKLPPEVVHEAKRAIVDTIGCALGGYESDARRIAERVLQRLGGVSECTIVGGGQKVSCLAATLINGIMVRYLDFNDTYSIPIKNTQVGSHSSEIIPGALALAERNRVSGRDFLASVVVGYELCGRMIAGCCEIPFAERGWNTDTRGAFVMPIVAGKLLGLTEDQVVNAVGISGAHGGVLGVLDAPREPYTMAKNTRFPLAAYGGLLAAFLAQEGFTGPERVLEGQRGFVEAIFQGDYNLEVLTRNNGHFRILDNRYKMFAAENTTQGHISCTLHLVRTHHLKPEDIDVVYVRAGSRAIAHTGDPAKRRPHNKETADHSSWYLTAVAIREGEVGPRQYRPEMYTDPCVLALIDRIHLEAVPEFDGSPAAGEVEIRTKSGQSFTHRVLHPKGTPQDPMSDADLERKFRDLAEVHIPGGRIDRLLEQFWSLDRIPDISTLPPLFAFDSR
jgi:2-methylcitrate dehydratase